MHTLTYIYTSLLYRYERFTFLIHTSGANSVTHQLSLTLTKADFAEQGNVSVTQSCLKGEKLYNCPARSLLDVPSCTWKLQEDAPSGDGDAKESFQRKLLGLFLLISSEHSACRVFCGWILKGSGLRKCEKLREKKRNQSVDKVVQHSAGV